MESDVAAVIPVYRELPELELPELESEMELPELELPELVPELKLPELVPELELPELELLELEVPNVRLIESEPLEVELFEASSYCSSSPSVLRVYRSILRFVTTT